MTTGYLALQVFLATERDRDARQWVMQLELLASQRAQGMGQWAAIRQQALNGLKDNVSLRLYVTEITDPDAPPDTREAPLTYLHHLLVATAQSSGFSASPPGTDSSFLPGLALTNAENHILVATEGFPPLTDLPEGLLPSGASRHPYTSTIHPLPTLALPAGLALRWPIYGVQADEALSEPLGYIIGLAPIDAAFQEALAPATRNGVPLSFTLIHPDAAKTERWRVEANALTWLDTGNDDNAYLHQLVNRKEGVFLKSAPRPTLVYAKPVPHTPWIITVETGYDEAMRETNARAFWMQAAILFITLAGLLLITTLWRHASAERHKEMARKHLQLAATIEKHEALLEMMARNTPVATTLLDAAMTVRYVNDAAARLFDHERAQLEGKAVEHILSSSRKDAVIAAAYQALTLQQEQSLFWKDMAEGHIRLALQSRFIPVELPPHPDEIPLRGVLIIEEDVTDLLRNETRHATMLNRLVGTLVELVDKRDPHAAAHSKKVAYLARALARIMGLDEREQHSAEIAGRLMNIGKISIPPDVLTAKRSLKSEESSLVQHAILSGAELLADIPFEGPVAETIRQSQENVDGSGPLGLQGEHILLTARIIRAANLYVAITSSRAWRKQVTSAEAIRTLLEMIDMLDRAVVMALVQFIEQERGHETLDEIGTP